MSFCSTPLVVLLALLGALHCTALPVDPNASQGLPLPENITYLGETVISIPAGILPLRDQALTRLEGKMPPAGAIQAALDPNDDVLTPIGEFLLHMLDGLLGWDRHQPVPAL